MHLDMQKGVYYAQLRVPKDAQQVIGKTAFQTNTANTKQA